MILTNTLNTILDAARRPGYALPRKLVLRQVVVDCIAVEDGGLHRLEQCGLPYTVEETIPAFPGFVVLRGPEPRDD